MKITSDTNSAFIRSLIAGHQETFAIPADFDWIVEGFPGWRNDTFGRGDFGAVHANPASEADAVVPGEAVGLREITLRGKSSLRGLFRFAGPAGTDDAAACLARSAADVALSALGHPTDGATRPSRAIAGAVAYASPSDYPDGTTAWWIHHCLLEGASPGRRPSQAEVLSHLRAVLASDPDLRSVPADALTVSASIRHWPFDTPHSSMAITITHAGTGEAIVPLAATSIAALVVLLAHTPVQRRLAFKMRPTAIDVTPYRTMHERQTPLDVAPAALAKLLAFLRRRNCSDLARAIADQADLPATRRRS